MIIIDSDCIIDFLKGKKEAVGVIEKYRDEVATTELNVFEVFFGIYKNKSISKRHECTAESFFDSILILHTDGWGKHAAKIFTDLLRKGIVIEQNDCLIVAIMLASGCSKIITRNAKHFSRIAGIEIITY